MVLLQLDVVTQSAFTLKRLLGQGSDAATTFLLLGATRLRSGEPFHYPHSLLVNYASS